MVIRNINLETVCGITSTLPDNTLPEIAFAGKSNVGKSSLINALMNRKSYARISATPGKTQTINFYNINEGFMPDWIGEFYAYYQWYYNIPSSVVIQKIPVEFLKKAYYGLHDLELELAVKKVGEI